MHPSCRASVVTPILIIAGLVAGCASVFSTGRPFDEAERRFFDDGIDVIGEPTRLGGDFGYEHELDLDGRVGRADLVAVVEVTALGTHRDIDGRETRRTEARVREVLYGVAPADELSLLTRADAPGLPFMLRHEARLTGRHLVFVRWFDQEDGGLGHHFHLSPDTAEMRAAVASRLEKRRVAEAKPRSLPADR